MAASWRSKIALRDLGNAKKIAAYTDDDLKATKGRMVIGYLFGKVSGVVTRTDPKTDEKFEGLAGIFATLPTDPESMEEIESSVLFIPDSFHNIVVAAWRKLSKDDPAAELEFAFEVAAIKANNPAGYSWDFKPAKEFVGDHPLKGTREELVKLARTATKALPAPRK